MRREIAAAAGHEVLFIGHLDESRMVVSLEVVARGNHGMVAVPRELCEPGDLVIHNHPSGSLVPSDADVLVAGELAQNGIGSAIVDNDVQHLYVMVEPVPPHGITPLDEEALADILDNAGAMSRVLPGFAPRESQLAMLRHVARGMNKNRVVVAEAGTGVGKSFAYLVPVVAWAAANRERIVIATATINLQQQLLEKDLVLVQRALRVEVAAALVKGRGNYLCHRRLAEQHEEAALFAEETPFAALQEWSRSSPTGSRSDLPFFVDDTTWNGVNSEADTCHVSRCPNREQCFVLRARQRAAGAQILVVNHHLLFSDLAIRQAGAGWEGTALLPPFHRLVFDEAHNIERSATAFFSRQVSRYALRRQGLRLVRIKGAHRFGILPELGRRGGNATLVEHAEGETGKFLVALERWNTALVDFLGDEVAWRLTPETAGDMTRVLGREFFEARGAIRALADSLGRLYRSWSEEEREESPLPELAAVVRRLEDHMNILDAFMESAPGGDTVLWMERRSGGQDTPRVTMNCTPLDIRDLMVEAVLEPYATVIFTSATLAVHGSFAYWGTPLGLQDIDEADFQIYPSPFDYPHRVLLAVPADAPEPESRMYRDYLVHIIPRLVQASHGGALVLFTSHRQMTDIYDAVSSHLESRGFACYRQGLDDRARLLLHFREDAESVLFATDSFWEGVDAPGDTLRQVILCRLPFRVPTDPVQIARAEVITQRGGNAFTELSLPQAVTRLKQGFGRLMRRGDDYGVVVVTDPRIARKWYGSVFMQSLPETARICVPGDETVDAIREFIAGFQEL